jgi:tripartite-type tricarboxylate transporter receptor subunit TctC
MTKPVDHGRRAGLRAILAAAAAPALVGGGAARAQAWPSKPIRIIIPFPPGNTLDVMSRLISPRLGELLGQSIVVENMAGASGQIGLSAVARAAPDGHTIGGGQGGTLVVLPHTTKNLQYDPLKDFVPVALSTTNYLGIAGALNAPFKTIPELIAYAKANPGKLTVATNGEGGFPHLAMEDFRIRAGFTYTHVPYKGSGPIVTDLAGGQVQAAFDGITGLTPQIRAGKIRLLAVTHATKVAQFPDAATVAEAVPGYTSNGWFGYIAPAGTPPAIVQRLNAAINTAMKQPDVVQKLDSAGLIVVAEPPAHFDTVIRADYAKYGKLVKDIGFQPQ